MPAIDSTEDVKRRYGLTIPLEEGAEAVLPTLNGGAIQSAVCCLTDAGPGLGSTHVVK